jgi:hypothetical protein
MTKAYDEQQLAFRAQHGFLVWEAVRVGNRQVEHHMRDGWQARLWGNLTEPQQDAMVEIEIGYRIIASGVGFKTFDPLKIPGNGYASVSNRAAEILSDYFSWGRELQRRRISHAQAIAVIVEGRTCNEVDRHSRQKNGAARINLLAALDTFCELRGWVQKPV